MKFRGKEWTREVRDRRGWRPTGKAFFLKWTKFAVAEDDYASFETPMKTEKPTAMLLLSPLLPVQGVLLF